MKFRLLPNTPQRKVGPHRENGKTYQPGEVIETDVDLAKKFPGKFELVSASGKERKAIEEEEESVETYTPYDNEDTEQRSPGPVFEPEEDVIEDRDDEDDDDEPKAKAKSKTKSKSSKNRSS